jgi:hypothetical protein
MVESTVAATAGATDAEGATEEEVAAPWLVATAGGGAAVVVPVAVETTGAVSVRETVVAVLVSEEPPEDAAEETEVVRELAALAELAELSDETMLDRIELAAVLVEAWLERDSINAELLAWLRLVAVNVVVAAGVVAPGVVVCPLPALQEASAMPRAAASLQMAEEAQVMVQLTTKVLRKVGKRMCLRMSKEKTLTTNTARPRDIYQPRRRISRWAKQSPSTPAVYGSARSR